MVEANIQLLAGAAVTVFLALLFFGVVVLWDVALALRSVGDKIDKLEDNIDDDLTDIAHSLDGMSGAPGGGGTQLHLSGGTISSGPTAGQAQGQPQQGTQTQAQSAPSGTQQTADDTSGHAAPEEPRQTAGETPQQHHQPARQPSEGSESATGDQTAERTSETGAEETDAEPESAAPDGDEHVADPDEADPSSDENERTETAEPAHPRATINRSRFITSPDRTAWYATPLDRGAIQAAQPSIAGELTDGSDSSVDESEIIAAGPVESADSGDQSSAASETVATPMPGDSDGTSEGKSDGGHEETDTAESASAEADPDNTEAAETESIESPDDSPAAGPDVLAFDEDEEEADGDGYDDEPSAAADSAATDEAVDEHADEAPEEPSDRSESTETEIEPFDDSDVDVPDTDADERSDDLERSASETDAVESAGSDDDEPAVEDETDAGSEIDQPLGDDVTAFEFDEPMDDDVTVEEAVDTINEDAPAPELSSHQFDVTAEVQGSVEDGADGEGAVLVFEFDTDTVDISGSTKRLLQYQMRSFADRDSTPDGDVTIGRDRIVIEIPDSDGTAVQRWGEAAVSIIDRTLYLSDNSSDDS